MGNSTPSNQIQKYNFDNLRDAIKEQQIIINTMPDTLQCCLIKGTVPICDEVKLLNDYLNKQKDIKIVIYGQNNHDETVMKKYKQLIDLGFKNVYAYIGGLFEWLLLQEIYGDENFPTTSLEVDILKYK